MPYNLNNAVGNILRGRSITSSLLSGLSGRAGGILSSFMQGIAKETADFYITDTETGDSMQLSYVPENVSAKCGTKFQTYNVIEKGEVKVPKGESLTSISWDGILPGEAMSTYPFIKTAAWEKPDSIIKRWEKWKNKGTKLKLMITQTPINIDVYLDNFSPKPSGGLGNIEYSISFVQAKDMLIMTVEEADAARAAAISAEAEDAQTQLMERTSMKKGPTEIVKATSTIWSIAQAATGDGGNWPEILANNIGKITAEPDGMPPGTILNIR